MLLLKYFYPGILVRLLSFPFSLSFSYRLPSPNTTVLWTSSSSLWHFSGEWAKYLYNLNTQIVCFICLCCSAIKKCYSKFNHLFIFHSCLLGLIELLEPVGPVLFFNLYMYMTLVFSRQQFFFPSAKWTTSNHLNRCILLCKCRLRRRHGQSRYEGS